MNRCALMLSAVLATVSFSAAAQAPRNFTAAALRGELVITAPPEVMLNRRAARLAPGSRMRGPDNMQILSGAAVGQRLLVNYTMDLNGNVLNVWILTPAEAARSPWPTTAAEAAAWSFNPDQQTWTKP